MPAVYPEDLAARITVQRDTPTTDAVGGTVHVWADLVTVWARYRTVGANEVDAARQQLGNEVAEFVVRSSTLARTFTVADQIVFDGSDWAIRAVTPLNEVARRKWVKLIAERLVP